MVTPTLPSEQTTRGLVTLTPSELRPCDAETMRGLEAANGRNPNRALTFRDALGVGAAVLVFIALFLISGCAAFSEGVKTARDAAKIGCAILESTDGTTKDVLDKTQELQRTVLVAAAQQAAVKGVDSARIEQDMRTMEALADALRLVSLTIVQASGTTPTKLVPCPMTSPTTP